MPILAPLGQADPAAVEALLDTVFGYDRHARTAYRLREGMAWLPDLSFGALDAAGGLIATIQCWPIALRDMAGLGHPLVLVGPVAVDPERQRDGIGRRLMQAMLTAAAQAGEEDLIPIGDPEYYGRFGFTADATAGWAVPGPVERRRLLARLAWPDRWPATGLLGPRRAALAATG